MALRSGPNNLRSTPLVWAFLTLLAACGGDAFTKAEGGAGGGDASAGSGGSDTGGSGGSDTGGTGGSDSGGPGGSDSGGPGGSGTGGTSTGCTSEQKLCAGKCVLLNDPDFGCSAETCEACKLQHVATHTCTDFACDVGECEDGWGNCDEGPTNGCEDALDSDAHCGSCSNACTDPNHGSSTCEDGNCRLQCDSPFTLCLDTCAIVGADVEHCQACQAPCPSVSNGKVVCANGVCSFTCNSGYTKCGFACVSLAIDSKNCGWCGHDCEGTSCSDGVCAGTVVDTAEGSLVALAVDPGHGNTGSVFWAENGSENTVWQCSKTLNSASSSFISTSPITTMAVDQSFLFVGSANSLIIRKNRGASGPAEKQRITTGAPMDMHHNAALITWAQTADAGIFTAPKALDSTTKVVGVSDMVSIQARFPLVEPITNKVYYAGVSNVSSGTTSFIAVHSANSIPVATLVADLPVIGGLAMNEESLFWTLPTDGSVHTTTKEDPGIGVIAANIPKVEAIAVDGDFAVWAQNMASGGQIIGRYGDQNRKLAAGEPSVCALALDKDHVYWINCKIKGQVKRVRR